MILAALLSVLAPALGYAQIYTWRDEGGNLVVSKAPRSGSDTTYAVVNVRSGIRATTPAPSRRAARFEPLIAAEAAAHDVRPDLVRAVIQAESAFDPTARSPKGAMGLMQLMPATAAELGVKDAYDPAENIRGGVQYLKGLLVKYAGNEELALAAYNAGPGAVQKYGAVPPFRETREYISRIRTNAGVRSGAPSVVRVIEVIDGREVTRFITVPGRAAAPAGPRANHR
ncbi:MAG TPA: transglycosylase SLT domain-containing protein [Vicinamibacterales bacterium]|nr:transglycosylase SLT domain-containing protein [Vicinamibacterales bacterium]